MTLRPHMPAVVCTESVLLEVDAVALNCYCTHFDIQLRESTELLNF